MIVWLACYAEKTSEVQVMFNATKILSWKKEPQPDALLRMLPECGSGR